MKTQFLKMLFPLMMATGLAVGSGVVHASVTGDLIDKYQQSGAQQPDPQKAKTMWTQKYPDDNGKNTRSCSSCHTDNLHVNGKHVRTNKPIDPMAPSVNKERLTDAKKIEKWFKRNCKWTLGRECSPQEKSDFLTYISNQ
ncbi:DUF1924 domain-containing protein [Kaarinaea lacus]